MMIRTAQTWMKSRSLRVWFSLKEQSLTAKWEMVCSCSEPLKLGKDWIWYYWREVNPVLDRLKCVTSPPTMLISFWLHCTKAHTRTRKHTHRIPTSHVNTVMVLVATACDSLKTSYESLAINGSHWLQEHKLRALGFLAALWKSY